MTRLIIIFFLLCSYAAQAKDALYCVSEAAYFEARGEGPVGMAAVASVILNRVKSRHYPNTPCEVVYQHMQFSYYWDGKPEKINDQQAWHVSKTIARMVLQGKVTDITNNATHYHSSAIRPSWITEVSPMCSIGRHLFYRLKEGKHETTYEETSVR